MRNLYSSNSATAIYLLIFFFFSPISCSTIPDKHEDQKYEEIKEILDSWQGDRAILELGKQKIDSLIQESPSYPPAYKELSRYYIKSGFIRDLEFSPGSLEAAEDALNTAIEIYPNYADGYVLFGHLYRIMGRPDDAIRSLERAEDIGTDNPWLYLNWADVLLDAGEDVEAAEKYQAVIDSGTADSNPMLGAYTGLIRYNKQTRNWARVQELYEQQIAFDPSYAWAYGNYASFLLFTMGDYERAIEYASEALEIMNYGVGRYTLAAALCVKWAVFADKRNDPDAARTYLEQAYSIYPDLNKIFEDTAKYRATAFTQVAVERYLLVEDGNESSRAGEAR